MATSSRDLGSFLLFFFCLDAIRRGIVSPLPGQAGNCIGGEETQNMPSLEWALLNVLMIFCAVCQLPMLQNFFISETHLYYDLDPLSSNIEKLWQMLTSCSSLSEVVISNLVLEV